MTLMGVGLRMICKMYGSMIIKVDGQTTKMYWDYVTDEPVPEKEWTKERRAASDKAKGELMSQGLEELKNEL